jgi:hypothetical protein
MLETNETEAATYPITRKRSERTDSAKAYIKSKDKDTQSFKNISKTVFSIPSRLRRRK